MNKDEMAVAAGFIALSVIVSCERLDITDPRRIVNMVSGGVSNWLDSGMDLENFLFASGADVDAFKTAFELNRLADLWERNG